MQKKGLDVPKIRQLQGEYCGVACLNMIFSYYGIKINQKELSYFFDEPDEIKDLGVYPREIVKVARQFGFTAHAFRNIKLEELIDFIDNDFPVIAECKPHWKKYEGVLHSYIVKGYDKDKRILLVNDPEHLRKNYFSYEEFLKIWNTNYKLGKNYTIRIR